MAVWNSWFPSTDVTSLLQVFDLKGSLRNRNVKTDSGKESCEVVLLDENLLKLIHDNPLYIRSHCKSILRAAIHSDAYFLSSHLIIDYSLLVGRDDATDQLVVGIIGERRRSILEGFAGVGFCFYHCNSLFSTDYIRTFTWDKRLEMVVKSTGILGGQGKSKPTESLYLNMEQWIKLDFCVPLM